MHFISGTQHPKSIDQSNYNSTKLISQDDTHKHRPLMITGRMTNSCVRFTTNLVPHPCTMLNVCDRRLWMICTVLEHSQIFYSIIQTCTNLFIHHLATLLSDIWTLAHLGIFSSDLSELCLGISIPYDARNGTWGGTYSREGRREGTDREI